jgi:3-oxoacyl-[acyl-carrier-protein] synthase II
MQRRVVVTGIGVITAIGTNPTEFWKNLLSGECGIADVESFDTSDYSVHRGAEVKTFYADDYVLKLNANRIGRASQFAIAAARIALDDAGTDVNTIEPERVGVSMGTTSGEPKQVEYFNDAQVSNRLNDIGGEFVSMYPCHVISEHIASELNLAGANMMIPTACAAGNYAIAYATDVLHEGQADVMLAGGADCFSRITYTGFARLGAVAPEVCQPFDKNRKGMIPGEGAAVLTLETLEHAIARNAKIYAEVGGYGLSCDAHHMTAAHPEGNGAVRAMAMALRESGLKPDDVSYISAHGTGTLLNDKLETIAVKQLFQETAYNIPISSIKSMLGHTMGAASAIEAAVCALAVYHNRIPPTINYNEPDPDCDLDYVPNHAREHKVNVAMSNAYAFGGNNASLILRKCEV